MNKKLVIFIILFLVVAVGGWVGYKSFIAGRYSEKAPSDIHILSNFDNDAIGILPEGFASFRTGPGLEGTWVVMTDPTAPSGKNVLAQTSVDPTDIRFPIAVATSKKYLDLDLSVKFKPISGNVDQAGGLVFRYQDANNYYMVRANGLEDNFRLYRIVAGTRTQFANSEAKTAVNQWHTLRVITVGDHIEAHLDEKKLIDAYDDTFKEAGLVGVWTKADSVTYFDDLAVKEVGVTK